MSGFVSFFKPMGAKLAKALSTRERQKRKAAAVRHAKLEKARLMDGLRLDAYKRDQGRCRVCQKPLRLYGDSVLDRAQLHHVKYLSAGGEDSIENTVILCAADHDKEHRHVISIDGNPEEVLTITTRDDKTGVVLDVRRSPCPA